MAAPEPLAFLRSTPPFDLLPPPLFEPAARALERHGFPAGTWLVRAGGEPLQHLYVIAEGSVRLQREGRALQVLEEGEVFGYTSLISGVATMDVVVEEDLVAYLLPRDEFQRLLVHSPFAGHFATGLTERLKASLRTASVPAPHVDFTLEVQQLVRREPVWVPAEASVGEAARVMRAERITSVLVRSEPPGIVTDRDFRNRVLAEGLGADTPVTRVFSQPLRSVEASAPIYDAWARLLDTGTHHLGVTREGAVVGVLSSSDLLRGSAQGPVVLLQRVERLGGRESLAGYGAWVAEMVSTLLAGGLETLTIASFVARLNDALVRRLLAWAEAELGPPPAPYAWIVFGSEGRMEQTLLTDQDNALVYHEAGAGRADWYAALAERVNADLQTAGFPPCTGGYMACNWAAPLSEWKRRFQGWTDEPNPRSLLQAAIFFDFRRTGGQLSLEPLEALATRSARKPAFLRFLARAAMEFRPPPLLLLRLRGEASEVDLKAQAISPLVFLARCYGLEAGSAARNTLQRLEAAARAGLVDAEVGEAVIEAYRFLLGLRLRLQLRQLEAGEPPTHKVAFKALSAIERSRLKDALRAIKLWQERAARHFQINF